MDGEYNDIDTASVTCVRLQLARRFVPAGLFILARTPGEKE